MIRVVCRIVRNVDASTPGAVEVTTWHLEMTDPADLREARAPQVDAEFLIAERPTVAYARWLYDYIGEPWHWTDRHQWTDEEWADFVLADGYHLATCLVGGVPSGYVECVNIDGDVEIRSFGLAVDVHGLGLGGWFLAQSIEYGFSLEAAHRVWLHTCTLDGPKARANYEARGFRLFKTEVARKLLE